MSDEALNAALASLLGARIDGAFANLETGLVALSVYAGSARVLGVGIGPRVTGVGWLPRAPRAREDASHALVAAMRAHLVDHRVRDASVDDEGTLWIVAGGQEAFARIALRPGRRGEVTVLGPDGRTIVRVGRGAGEARREEMHGSLEEHGAAMLEANERFARENAWATLVRAVGQRATMLERRAVAVRADRARLDDVGRLQKIGRLLLAQGDRVARGTTLATLEDWEDGGTIGVALAPDRPAKSQAEALFARARRLQRGAAVMQKRLDEAEQLAAALRALLAAIASAPQESAPEPWVLRARALGVAIEPAAASRTGERKPKVAPRKPYLAFRGVRDAVILVGRGGRDNDTLTTQHARPHDLWLHARGTPGAHVVVPLARGASCPPDLLADAATLAAHFSDARGAPVCEVSWVERRYVRKPRGADAGAVTLEREKVLALRLEPDRLARLLATREGA